MVLKCSYAREERKMENSIIEELLYKAESIMEHCRPKTKEFDSNSIRPVSYTHLDVYKRQRVRS